jgi:hypothetical protein
MATQCDRVFSAARRTLTPERNALGIKVIVSDLGGKVVASRRQNRARQLEDTWPVGFCTYIDVTLLLGR